MNPVFSVVIPTHARPQPLLRCLEAVARQQFSQAFEVIVVDDGNLLPPGFESQAAKVLDLTILHQPKSGAAIARNRGAQNARGEYLAFVDDDCEPDPGWLSTLEQTFRAQPQALVGGRVVNALKENRWSAASQLLVDFLYAFYTDRGGPRFFCSDNLAVSRQAFEKLGGFDETFGLFAGEDRDLCARWAHAGGLRIYEPQAVVRHAHFLTLSRFCRQHFQYGRGAFHFRWRSVSGGRGYPRLEPLRFYIQLLRYPFRVEPGATSGRLETALLLVLAQVLNATGFFTGLWRSQVEPQRVPAVQEPDAAKGATATLAPEEEFPG